MCTYICNSVFHRNMKFLAEDEMKLLFLQMNKYFVKIKLEVLIY